MLERLECCVKSQEVQRFLNQDCCGQQAYREFPHGPSTSNAQQGGATFCAEPQNQNIGHHKVTSEPTATEIQHSKMCALPAESHYTLRWGKKRIRLETNLK